MLIVLHLLVLLIASWLPGALADSPGGSASNEQRLNKANDGHGSLPLDSIAKMINDDHHPHFRFKRGLDTNQFLSELNHARRQSAKYVSIANMHALSWDEGLVFLAGKLCTRDRVAAPGRVYFAFRDHKFSEEYEDHVRKQMAKGDNFPEYMGHAELVHPRQTKIGCVEMECKVTDSNLTRHVELEGLCILGPYETFEKSDFRLGPAGSQCARENDGLCDHRSR